MLKIVLIDDEEKIRMLIKNLIPTDLDLQVIGEASDGIEGLDLCRRYQPQIVITDIRMPEMDGLVLMEKLSEILPAVKVIVVSGYDDFDYAQKAIENGATGYLLKPVDECELQRVLQRTIDAIEQRQKEKEYVQQMKLQMAKLQNGLSATESEEETPVYSDNPVIQKVVAHICANYNQDISLDEIATKMYMNSSYLSRLFKEETGQCFRDFLARVRINRARTLLRKPEIKVHEIADMLGYRDASYFISVFKKQTGWTPNDYRNQNK